MAVYPSSVRTFSTHTDLNETVFALHVNDLQDELVAVQAELGVLPKGTYGSVKLRLDALASSKSDAGHDHTNRLDNPAHDVTGRHQFGSALGNPDPPSTQTFGDVAAVGSGDNPSKEDHKHRMPTVREAQDLLIPAGTIWAYGGTSAPAGWAFCDGAVLTRPTVPSDAYYALFQAIGVRYNTGGETGAQFRLPNLLSRFPMGASSTGAAVSSGGFADATLVSHQHSGSSVTDGTANHRHYVSHGHHIGGNGNHRHMDDLGFNYLWRHNAADNDYTVTPSAANRASGITFTEHRNTGSHDHSTDSCDRDYTDNSDGNPTHGHGLTVAWDGIAATNRNLPPYQTVNYIIKV